MPAIDIDATSSAAATGAVGIVVALALAATGSGVGVSSGNLDINAHRISAYSEARATSVSSVDVKNSQVSAYSTGFATSSASIGMFKDLSASEVCGASSNASLSMAIKVSSVSEAKATTTCELTPRLSTLGVCHVVTEILNLWGIEKACSAPDFALARAIGDVNSAMQTVWNQANERSYWSSSTLTLTLADGEDSSDLPDDIQNVVGPCRLEATKRPLTPIGTIGELETFADIYLDGETASEPVAYHIERLNQTGDDPAKSIFRITPPVVGASVAFLLEVVKEAPRFTVGDIGLCPAIPIPHRYVESLLLPIARYRASSFWLFNNQDSKPTIDRDYQMAMEAIGMADPLAGKSGDNRESREATK